MTRQKFLILAGVAAVALAGGLWLNANREKQQSNLGGGKLFPELEAKLGDVAEIRLSKGDGRLTTLKRGDAGWTVVERNFPADPARVRELALALARLEVVETKTSDPANYAKLGVEPLSPTAGSTLVEVVAGEKTFPLLVGKSAEGRAIYVRKPDAKASALAQPNLVVDPDQKRWVDRQLTDIAGGEVHEIAVKPATGASYLLTRPARGVADLTLSPVPKGRVAASPMSLNGQAESLSAFNFDDVRALQAPAPAATDHATYKTFDGQIIELAGRRDGDKAFITISTARDDALAAKFKVEAPKAEAPKAAATPATNATPAAEAAKAPAPSAVDRLATRIAGVEFEIPLYKYEGIFRPQEDLLEPKK